MGDSVTAFGRLRRLDRRNMVLGCLATVAIYRIAVRSDAAQAEQTLDVFEASLAAIVADPSLAASLRLKEDLTVAEEFGIERVPLRTPKSSTPIAQKASDLIIACEVSSEVAYKREYYRPTWPKGASGVTIGIGYDVGYVTPAELAADWQGILSDAEVSQLSKACGVTREAADALLSRMQSVSISWEDAIKEYYNETQPRYVGLTEASLANTNELAPESLGALVSLVYNRGASFSIAESKDPSGRFREMRNIKQHMESKTYDQIPEEFRSMKRLWEGQRDMRGLLLRRDAEAALFAYGLTQPRK
jgi:GH24 family phage-related lysozyme (muramidase)